MWCRFGHLNRIQPTSLSAHMIPSPASLQKQMLFCDVDGHHKYLVRDSPVRLLPKTFFITASAWRSSKAGPVEEKEKQSWACHSPSQNLRKVRCTSQTLK
ncbi:hypothetical protein M758_3G031200 [Ceratodon purpureus]|nr:hypothetical protein M758_3G031200 [Ceratodon purpureus]